MKMTQKLVIVGAMLVTGGAVAASVSQGVSDAQSDGGAPKAMRAAFKGLNLSDEQQRQLKALKEGVSHSAYQRERAELEAQVQALVQAEALDADALSALADAVAEQHRERFVKRVAHQHAVMQVLDADQRAQWQSKRGAHGKQLGQQVREGKRGHRRGGERRCAHV